MVQKSIAPKVLAPGVRPDHLLLTSCRSAMTDKRRAVRKRKRLLVRFDRTATFTVDVSAGGFCVGTVQVLPVNSPLSGSVQVDGRQIPFTGRVAWSIPGDRRLSLAGKMGITFEGTIRELADPGDKPSAKPSARGG